MRSGLMMSAMDRQIRPQDDLFGYVNGEWLRSNDIPPDRGRYGTFDELREAAEEHLRELLEAALTVIDAHPEPPSDDMERLRWSVGALYASMLDQGRVDSLGLTPIEADLAAVDEVSDLTALWQLLGRWQREGAPGAVNPIVSTDDRDADQYIVYLDQAGLGLPDESYYHDEQYAPIRAEYVSHLERMFGLAGRPDPAAEAADVMALETRLADAHWDRVANRDPVATYTKVTGTELAAMAEYVPWAAWVAALHGPSEALAHVIARQPSFLTALSQALAEVPLSTWQAWARWQVLRGFAPYLPDQFVQEHFAFYGRTLSGTPQLRERWKRATTLVDTLMGEALGRLYVAKHFGPTAKERMQVLVANLVEAYRRDIAELAWMSPETRAKALAKLDAFTPKIGYPDQWRDYSGLRIDPTDLVGNVRRGNAFDADRQWAKLGGPVDRGEWFMTAQTVNAYYHPGLNEIVFPAAILQPPFFDVEADDAINYGAIGSVIGHEIGHGFDDQGSKFDGTGNLVDWWTEQDRAAFDALSGRLIAQYDGFEPRELPGEHVNGALTVGENIGDLGGVTIAHLAYRIALGNNESPVIDGLTGDQRFFAGWAQIWRMKARTEEAKRLLAIDPHSPGEFRANIVRNLTEFYDAFDVGPGDQLWLPEAERVRIW